MLSLPKIIAPIDFSERSPGAARYAGRLACHFHAELTLLHVIDSGAYEVSAYEFTGPVVSALPAERRHEAEALLANFLPGEFRNMNVRRVVLSDADRENPFPRSANKIVNWLQHFKAEGAEPLDVSAQDICPTGTLQQIDPAVASTQSFSSPEGCIK